MWDPERFKVVCYLAWCGAEATYRFASESRYNAARDYLDKIAKGHLRSPELPAGYSGAVTDLYFIEMRDRASFEKFMQEHANL